MTTIHNLYTTYVEYDTEDVEDCDVLTMIWDSKFDKEKDEFVEKELNELMRSEYHNYKPEKGKASFMWVEKFKEVFNYELGKEMYILTKANADGYFNAYKQEKKEYGYMFIDEEGYINIEYLVEPFDGFYEYDDVPKYESWYKKVYIRPDCIYNDNIYKNIKKEREEKEKKKPETDLKNLQPGDIIEFESCVYLNSKQSWYKYEIQKVCAKSIKMRERWSDNSKKTDRIVKKEKLLYYLKLYGYSIQKKSD